PERDAEGCPRGRSMHAEPPGYSARHQEATGWLFCYSSRSTVTGSRNATRRAGTSDASPARARTRMATDESVIGSEGDTPYNMPDRPRASATDTAIPPTHATPTSNRLLDTSCLTMTPRIAP